MGVRQGIAVGARRLHDYHRMWIRRLLLIAVFSVAAGALGAQGVRGVVVTGDSVPVRGAVVSLLDSLGVAVVSGLSDEFGRFDLRAPRRGNWRLRTEAVGFARVTSFALTLAAAEVLERRVQLTDATAVLRGVEVRDRLQCGNTSTEGTQVALLWDEARKSLAAAALSVERAPAVAVDQDEIEYDASFQRVRSASRITTTGRADRGARSDAPRALRQLGYARRIDTTVVYFAPDAGTLLSDDFAATHCFGVVANDPTSIRRVGISFSPASTTPGKVDIVGTLWLDRETYALDRVEFRYDPLLSAEFADSTFGGRVRFARLATGHVVIAHWVLRMPIIGDPGEDRLARSGQTSQMLIRPESRREVVGIRVSRGVVRAFDASPEPLPMVTASPRRFVGAPSCMNVAPVGGNAGALVGDVRDQRARVQGGARVRASWHQPVMTGGRMVFREQWVEAGADPSGRYALCALPRGVPLTVSARTASASSLRPRIVLSPTGVAPALELTLATERRAAPATATGVVEGRLLAGAGRPVAGAEIRVFPGTTRLITDSLGGFRITDAAPGSREFLVRRLGYAPLMVAVDVTAGDTASVVVSLAAAAQQLAPVTIEASVTSLSLGGFELRRAQRTGGGSFIGSAEIRERENSSIEALLRSFSRVRVEQSGATGETRVYGRGGDNPLDSDRCTMNVLVDGAMLPDDSPIGAVPPLREIAGIEIYQSMGAIPPQFSFAWPKCGLIIIWTRDGAVP